MADSNIAITTGSGTNVDTRTIGSEHRQVVVVGDPATSDSVAVVRAADPGSNSAGVVVREPNTTAIVSGLRDVRIQSIVDGTIGTIPRVDRIFNLIDGTISTVTGIDRVRNIIDGTISTVVRVSNLVDGTISSVPRVDRVFNLIDGTISTVTGVDRVRNLVDGTISTIPRVDRVFNLVDGTISVVTTVGRVNNVVDGTISLANIQATAVVAAAGGVVAGSTSGVSVSGVTIISPEASRNIKVYALSLTTTAQVGSQIRFTNGAGTSPTTFWQVALQAPSQGIAGANLSVTPPGYLFATGSNTTLALVKDTGSLLHYAVSYFKESA